MTRKLVLFAVSFTVMASSLVVTKGQHQQQQQQQEPGDQQGRHLQHQQHLQQHQQQHNQQQHQHEQQREAPIGQPAAPLPVQHQRENKPQAEEAAKAGDVEKQILEYAKSKNLPMVMRLLGNVGNFYYDDGTSEGTLLHYAAFHGWTNLMDILIKDKQVNPNLENRYDKRTPLLSACRGGRLDSVKYCVKSLKKADWSSSNENGLTCSHFAAREGHPEVLSYMIELNKLADIPYTAQSHKSDKKLNWTPLHYAANNGHTDCAIILLLEAGANPYKRGFRMQSPIDLARARGDKNLVDIMHDPLKYKIMSLIEASLGSERKAREKAITSLREDLLKMKEALASVGPESESAGRGGAPPMLHGQGMPAHQQMLRRRRQAAAALVASTGENGGESAAQEGEPVQPIPGQPQESSNVARQVNQQTESKDSPKTDPQGSQQQPPAEQANAFSGSGSSAQMGQDQTPGSDTSSGNDTFVPIDGSQLNSTGAQNDADTATAAEFTTSQQDAMTNPASTAAAGRPAAQQQFPTESFMTRGFIKESALGIIGASQEGTTLPRNGSSADFGTSGTVKSI